MGGIRRGEWREGERGRKEGRETQGLAWPAYTCMYSSDEEKPKHIEVMLKEAGTKTAARIQEVHLLVCLTMF